MVPVMNDTKWAELRAAMHALGDARPRWRTRIVGSGVESGWDREWFHHVGEGGYADIEWVEIGVANADQASIVLAALRAIHLPGVRTDAGFKVFGYLPVGQACDYL